jgi:hypothetical protein
VLQPSGQLGVLPDDVEHRQEQLSGRQALSLLAVSEVERDWMFAREQRLQHVSRQALMDGWDRQTDGRLGELLPLRLARALLRLSALDGGA